MRLRKAYLRAVLGVRVDDYGAGAHGDREMGALMVIESERLLREAYSVLTLQEKAIIISVCGHDDWSGGDYRMHFLRLGLDKVAAKWGIK